MKCEELNIWINKASDEELRVLPENIAEHFHACKTCRAKLSLIQQSFEYINSQKQETLSEEKSEQIIAELLVRKSLSNKDNVNGRFIFSRVAAILIIAFGLLVGIVAGGLLFSESNSDENPWSNEFTLLSENTEYTLFE